MIGLSAVSPFLREKFINYTYAGGLAINLLAALITFMIGRRFEKIWAVGFAFLAVHQGLNLLPSLPYFPYLGDVFYMGFYLMLFAGNIMALWEAGSVFMLSTVIVLSVLVAVASMMLAFLLPAFNQAPLASFFNIFYVLFAFVNVIASLRSAITDRAWILRTLAFGIIAVTEVWFVLWAYGNYEPSDPSVMWFGVVMLAVLSQRPIKRRMRIVRF